MERTATTTRKRTSDSALALATRIQVLPVAMHPATRSARARGGGCLAPPPSSPDSEEANSSSSHATARTPATTAASGGETPPVDDKVLRRRLQYKMHQRRHRAKQKAKIETLEHEVHGLLSDVASLEVQCKRLAERSVFTGRSTPSGQPARVALEYFRTYEHGWSPQRYCDQERFLECAMKSNLEGPDYTGVEFVKYQWRLYGHYFASTQYTVHSYDVSVVDDMTIVVADATICFRPRRDGVTALCPSLHGQEDLIQDVIGNAIVVPGKYRFMFDSTGRVSWFGADLDFVSGLQRTFGSLEKVAAFMRGANMSFGTGQIQCEPMSVHQGHSPQQRHHLQYLLS